jgi:type IV secretion system protein VirD4
MRSGRDRGVIARSFAAHVVARKGSERDAFWLDWAETLVSGAIGYAMELPRPQRNMNTVFNLFNDDDPTYKISLLLDDKALNLKRPARTAFCGLLQLPDRETRPSVMGSTQAVLRLWDSDLIRRITGTTSFDIDALIDDSDERPMTLYIIVPAYRSEAYRPILRLWFGGLLMALMQRQKMPECRTLIILDETASFGRVDAFLTATTQARAFGVQLWTHWQNAARSWRWERRSNSCSWTVSFSGFAACATSRRSASGVSTTSATPRSSYSKQSYRSGAIRASGADSP